MVNEAVKEMFKTSDLSPTDKLYTKKKDCLDEVKRLFTTNFNYSYGHKYYENKQGENTGIGVNRHAEDAHYKSLHRNRKFGLYCEPVFLQPHQVAYALEERKAFLKWILTQAPWMNVPVANPQWTNGWVASVDTGEDIFMRDPYSKSREEVNTGMKFCRILDFEV